MFEQKKEEGRKGEIEERGEGRRRAKFYVSH